MLWKVCERRDKVAVTRKIYAGKSFKDLFLEWQWTKTFRHFSFALLNSHLDLACSSRCHAFKNNLFSLSPSPSIFTAQPDLFVIVFGRKFIENYAGNIGTVFYANASCFHPFFFLVNCRLTWQLPPWIFPPKTTLSTWMLEFEARICRKVMKRFLEMSRLCTRNFHFGL